MTRESRVRSLCEIHSLDGEKISFEARNKFLRVFTSKQNTNANIDKLLIVSGWGESTAPSASSIEATVWLR